VPSEKVTNDFGSALTFVWIQCFDFVGRCRDTFVQALKLSVPGGKLLKHLVRTFSA